jgi:hypothetical protein
MTGKLQVAVSTRSSQSRRRDLPQRGYASAAGGASSDAVANVHVAGRPVFTTATGMRPARTPATAQRRAAAKNQVRQDGRQKRCGFPPVSRGENERSHQRQMASAIILVASTKMTDEEHAALLTVAQKALADDPFPLSPRLAPLKSALAKLDPASTPRPLPFKPPLPEAPMRSSRGGRRARR